MALYKISGVRKKIEFTPYTALEFEVSAGEGRHYIGKLVTENGANKPTFDWTATYSLPQGWDVLPVGATKVGSIAVDRGFTRDAVVNRAIKLFISEELVNWRKELTPKSDGFGNKVRVEKRQNHVEPSTPPSPAQIVVSNVPVSANAPPPRGISGEVVLQIPLEECICFQRQENDPAFSGQPRKYFDEGDLQKLAGSLKKHGQKVPALVRRIATISGKKWELIAGERRWRALQIIGFPYLRAIEEKPASKQQQHMLALIENLFRVDPSPLELSNALQEQVEAGETQASLAEATSLSYVTIKKLLSIQALHPELKVLLGPEVLEEDRIRLEEANALGKIHPDHQVEIWNQAKGQPNHRLILAKIHQLGKGLFLKTTPRKNRYLQAYQIKERIKKRLNALNLALIELKAVTPEEWRQFVTLRETDQISLDMSRLTEASHDIDEIKQKISRAKVAVRSNAPDVPGQ